MGSSERRRLARAGIQSQKKAATAGIASEPESTYRFVGGIESEVFEIPATSTQPPSTAESDDTIDSIASQTDTIPDAGSNGCEVEITSLKQDEDQQSIAYVAKPNATQNPFQSINGFDSTFKFERHSATTSSIAGEETASRAQAAQVKGWNDPTVTSYRRITAIFDDTVRENSSSEGSNSSGSATDLHHVPSIFDCLELSSSAQSRPMLISPAVLANSSEDTLSQQDAPVHRTISFGPALPPSMSSHVDSLFSENHLYRRNVLGEPTDMISAKIISWARSELVRYFQIQAEQLQSGSKASSEVSHVPNADHSKHDSWEDAPLSDFGALESGNREVDMASDRALVLYQYPHLPSHEASYELPSEELDEISFSPSPGSETDGDSSWSSHSTGRVFLSSIDGELFVVNPTQLLYNVRIIDETASDFDSIASPTKPDPLTITEIDHLEGLDFHHDEYTPEESGASEHYECAMPEFGGSNTSEVSGHDPFADFSSFGAIHDLLVEHLHLLPRDEQYEQGLQDSGFDDQTDFETGSALDLTETERDVKLRHKYPTEEPPLDSDDVRNENEEDLFVAAATSSNIAAAAWSRELAHTMLGTESMFTFLNELKVEGNCNATKEAVATAFLQLVDYERLKLGEALLPQSCNATTILGSRILPHTTMLGTTTLASFLFVLDFGIKEEVSVVEIYRAFKGLSEAEQRASEMATAGIMGELGRQLGKLI
ncbi:hypothetical protein N0V83_003610 [Neocucurbitaria cava]|uniref:Uncharacterized protein n=1 Tax=Neocucurbitaria cava TaxID=798079 RepID=A0A9W8YCK1_9PLEO|nr:hypothetical protein N0V83_003610 [Neocucurbitaria cava]